MVDLVQIVPRLPPAIDGVGDYAFLLAQQMRKAHGIQTTFVVCDTTWENGGIEKVESRKQKAEIEKTESGNTFQVSAFPISAFKGEIAGFPVYQLRERSAAELLRMLSAPGMPQTVLLQYVGYGYEKRGCP